MIFVMILYKVLHKLMGLNFLIEDGQGILGMRAKFVWLMACGIEVEEKQLEIKSTTSGPPNPKICDRRKHDIHYVLGLSKPQS